MFQVTGILFAMYADLKRKLLKDERDGMAYALVLSVGNHDNLKTSYKQKKIRS